MTKLTLKQLDCLIAVDDTRHFHRAAERCGITQPSLSAQIQSLEEVVRCLLVERSRSGVALTPMGREIVRRARYIQQEVRELLDYAETSGDGLAGTIRLGTTPTIGPYLLPFVVSALHKDYKSLKLYIREESAKDLDRGLERGTHDVVLTQLPASSEQFYERLLFREPLYVAMAKDHPLAGNETVAVADLAGQDVLALGRGYRLYDQIQSLCEQFGARLVSDYEGTSLDALRQMVGMGMGLTFLPALYVRSEIRTRSEIAVKPLKGRNLSRPIGLVWRKSAGRADMFQRIGDAIEQVTSTRLNGVLEQSGATPG